MVKSGAMNPVAAAVASLAILAAGSSAAAQGLPPLSPLNPVVEMRSGLATLPWLAPETVWHVLVTTDYGSLAEYTSTPSMDFVLDAEFLSTRALVARRIGSQGFVLAGTSWNVAGDGRLDDFMGAFHELFGVGVIGRDRRPENTFGYYMDFDGANFE